MLGKESPGSLLPQLTKPSEGVQETQTLRAGYLWEGNASAVSADGQERGEEPVAFVCLSHALQRSMLMGPVLL